MMWVCDLGNTRVRWAWHDGQRLSSQGSAVYAAMDLQGQWHPSGERVVVVSVASEQAENDLQAWLLSTGAVEVQFLRTEKRSHGVSNAYADVSQMGVDRWAAMVAAFVCHQGPVAVIDCGSAITVDVVSENGLHLGGAILPGLAMMSASLTLTTARIGAGDQGGDQLLGRSTAECVSAGILAAASGGIEKIMNEAESRMGGAVQRILCGGDAQRVAPWLDSVKLEPDLVLLGAYLLAKP